MCITYLAFASNKLYIGVAKGHKCVVSSIPIRGNDIYLNYFDLSLYALPLCPVQSTMRR